MVRLNASMLARGEAALLASAVMAIGSGCAGGLYAEPASNVEAPPVVAGPVADDGDVVYVQDAPVVDIETYPSVLYGGVTVYYVGGRWYHRDPRGWAYYRREPTELGRQREEHFGRDHDPRWGDQRAAEHQGPGERAVQPAERRGATEAQPPDRNKAAPVQARREETRPAATAPRRRGQAPVTAPKPAPNAKKRSPTPAPGPTRSERR